MAGRVPLVLPEPASAAAGGPDLLTLTTAPDGCLLVRGAVDVATAWVLDRALDDPGVAHLDGTGVSFFGAAGLHVLLRANETRRLTLRSPSSAIVRVLDLLGLLARFDVRP